jgi:hypothetical protein
MKSLGLFGAAVLPVVALVGCSGGGSGGGSGAPPPAPAPATDNQAPTAAFDAAVSVVAGVPLALDAAGSSDPDGDTLTYSWKFGDGTYGGGVQLAHVYTAPGDYSVTLTVDDGHGGSAQSMRAVNVQAGSAPGVGVQTRVLVVDGSGPLSGVTVGIVDGGASATTVADGTANISTGTGAPVRLRFSKPGFADQIKAVELPAGATSGAYLEVTMQPRASALTLPDAAAGGMVAGTQGANVTLPANALVDASGNPVTGAVQVSVTPVDVGTNPGAFPGLFQGLQPAGTRGLLASYGTVEYVFAQNGASLQLAPGKKATIEIPVYTSLNIDGSDVTPGATIPLWSLDERTSIWVQEGTGTVVTNNASPSGLALRADVSHFTWWNCDQWLGGIPDGSYNPTVKCCIKDTPNGPCKENSGDICAHTGSGSPNSSNSIFAQMMAAAATTRRIPTTAAFATGDAKLGVVLPMPADLDINLVSTAYNGTYRGTAVLRGSAGTGGPVTVDLFPVQGGGNSEPITLPWNQTYAMQAQNEVDTFKLDMPAGPGFEVRVSRDGSNLSGQVKVTRPGGGVVAQQSFNAAVAYVPETTVATAGEYNIEVTAGTGAPGGYRLEVTSFGACSGAEVLTLPSSQVISMGPQQVRCYDIALAADAVIKIDPGQATNLISGSFSLGTENGAQQLAARTYPGSTPVLTGVAVAGTYRLRVSNTTQNSGTFALNITQPAAEVLAVPGSGVINDLAQFDDVRLFLVKPPANGLFHVTLSATGIQAGASVDPMLTILSAGCGNCGTTVTQSTGRALRATAPALPVVQVFKNGGNSVTNTIVVATGVPTLITKDATITGNVGATPQVYGFDANVDDPVAYALAVPEATSSEANASLRIFQPSGAEITATSPVKTLTQTGLHTALVSLASGTSSDYAFRINTAPPVEALALTPPVTQRAVNLPLGQVLRYGFDLAQGELAGLSVNTPGPLFVQAAFAVADVYSGYAETPTFGTGPFAEASPPLYVRSSKPYILTMRSFSNIQERASGDVTLGIVKPNPVAATVNVANSGSLASKEWTSYSYTVPATGRYLLRVRSNATPSTLAATLWAGSSPFTNYSGEMTSGWSTSFPATDGLKQLDAGNFTMTVRNTTSGAASTSYSATLVDLEAPTVLTPGAAASAGAVDADGERDYYSFAGTAGQAYTVRVTSTFGGTLRVRKQNANGDFTDRGFNTDVTGSPAVLASGVEKSLTFTIPATAPFGSGTYIIEIVADGAVTGDYSVQVTSP